MTSSTGDDPHPILPRPHCPTCEAFNRIARDLKALNAASFAQNNLLTYKLREIKKRLNEARRALDKVAGSLDEGHPPETSSSGL